MTRAIAVALAGSLASVSQAGFVGWTATVREVPVSGGYLVNVFAVTDNATDVLLNVFGGTAGNPNAGFITTTSHGGFLQGGGAQAQFAPAGSQSWTTLDSFLTVGGGFNSSTGAWTANSSTVGDPPWLRSYFDSAVGDTVQVNAFNTPSNGDGFTNPYVSYIPETAGWFFAGATDPATSPGRSRSLAGLTNRVASSNAAAAAGTLGVMVAQFYLLDDQLSWRMGATVRQSDGSTSVNTFSLVVPAPGAVALLAAAGLVGTRRRR